MAQQTINIGSSANDPTAESVRSAFNKTNSNFAEVYNSVPGHNVLAYGALGNSNYSTGGGANDRQAFLDAAAAAASVPSGYGAVIVPGNRTYRLGGTGTLTWPQGVHLIGTGGLESAGQATPPTILWDGAAGGVMFDVVVTTANIFTTRFHNVLIRGQYVGGNAAANGVKFSGTGGGATTKLDSGTIFEDVWFQLFNGNAIHITGNGATNFRVTGGRFDSIFGGYGIYVNLTGTGRQFIGVIDGNTTWVGGSAGQGKGFLHLDGEGASNFGLGFVTINGLHTECNQDLTETFALGTNPYDKQGIIRCGVTAGLGNFQHQLNITGWHHSFPNPIKSHSCIQITAASGTSDANAADCIGAIIDGGDSLHQYNSSDSATTNEVRLFGGQVPANRRYPWPGYRHQHITWGQGKDSSYEGLRSYIHTRYGAYKMRGLGLQAETVADLATPVDGLAGPLATVTDCSNTAAVGDTVSSGGSKKALCWYNGANWKIIAF